MFGRIFPKVIDNVHRGHWLGIWLLLLVVVLKTIQGVESIVNTRDVATTADGIPFDGLGAASVDVVLTLFALLGLNLLVIPVQSLLVLIRYRAMIPLMYLFLLIVYAGGRTIVALHPIPRSGDQAMGFAGHPIGFYVNLAILGVTLIGFALSLYKKAESPRQG